MKLNDIEISGEIFSDDEAPRLRFLHLLHAILLRPSTSTSPAFVHDCRLRSTIWLISSTLSAALTPWLVSSTNGK